MKQLIFLFSFFLFCNNAFAQYIENGGFLTNSRNIVLHCPEDYSYTADAVSGLTNWTISHGSPNFPTDNEAISSDPPPPNSIHLVDNGGVGEGIVGGYQFTGGNVYTIKIGIYDASNLSGIHIVIGKGPRPYNGACSPEGCRPQSKNGPFPSNFDDDHIWQLVSPLSVGQNCLTFPVPVGQTFDWIWVYARDVNSCNTFGNEATSVRLTYVYVVKECKPSITFSGLIVSPFLNTGYNDIYAGSSYGTTTSLVNVVPTVITVFEATESITLQNNFVAQPSSTFFLAQIEPFSCGANPPNTDLGSCFSSGSNVRKTGDLKTEVVSDFIPGIPKDTIITKVGINKDIKPQEFNIYPNPNNGSFTIETPRGNYDIQIIDVLGVVVQQENIKNDSRKNITLLSELAPGNYMVNIKGNGYSEVRRITLVR